MSSSLDLIVVIVLKANGTDFFFQIEREREGEIKKRENGIHRYGHEKGKEAFFFFFPPLVQGRESRMKIFHHFILPFLYKKLVSMSRCKR